MTNQAPITDDRFVLAFYGAEPPSEAVERFFRLAVSWFTDLGFPPDRLGVTGPGYGAKTGTFRRGVKRVEALGFSAVENFEVNSLMPNDVSGSLHFASGTFSRGDRFGRYAVLSVPASRASKDVWLPVAREVIECLRPAYGMAFNRTVMKGPVWYALGINMMLLGEKPAVGDEHERARSISRWSDIGMRKEVYREGLLRYVYHWNFLTQPQLDRKVHGTSLADWIKADPQRGKLKLLSHGVLLWEVQDCQLEQVRDVLADAGAIFDWRKYCNVEPHIKTKLA